MFHLYIDTNVLLSLYHFTTDELGELDKLRALLKQQKAQLYLPEQTRTEFRRNRDNKIADALKRLNEQKFSLQFPQFCRDYPEYDELRKLEAEMRKKLAGMVSRANEDIASGQLDADRTIAELFKGAQLIRTTPEQVTRARLRLDLGNPPGKGGSLGDAINWEALLDAVPGDSDLVFITSDKDYASPLKDDAFHSFLIDEWKRKKKGKIIFYKRLASFFKDHFPNSVLATDLEKELLIKDLRESPSFASTHAVVARLSTYKAFNKGQRSSIVEAALSNSQVRAIVTDPDVHDFLSRVIEGHDKAIDSESLERLKGLLEDKPDLDLSDDDDDLPF